MNRISTFVLAAVFGAAMPLLAQSAPSATRSGGGLEVTRTQLEEELADLQSVAQSSVYSGRLRSMAERNADLISERLATGDFRVGDRIVLYVEGESLPDTLAVEPGPQITLPVMGVVPLEGVLRSELENHLRTELGRFIQDPQVSSQSLIRLGILGQVGQPGFFVVPADMLIDEALMLAGGPGARANLEELRIDRGQRRIWEGQILQEAMIDGTTLDQLNLRGGRPDLPPGASDQLHLGLAVSLRTTGGVDHIGRGGRRADRGGLTQTSRREAGAGRPDRALGRIDVMGRHPERVFAPFFLSRPAPEPAPPVLR